MASAIGADRRSERFAEQGYLGPLDVLSWRERRRFLALATSRPRAAPLDWYKGYAASLRPYYDVATHPAILDVVSELLGDDVVIWGATLRKLRRGEWHPWHTDIESSSPAARSVSVWIGLENSSRVTSPFLLSRSHRFGLTLQEARAKRRRDRLEVGDEEVLGWAREQDARSDLVASAVRNGQALFLDGHLWHAARNDSRRRRLALLLQYATPDTAIRMPVLEQVDWPFRWRREPRPPCIMVSGHDAARVNRIVPPPTGGPRRRRSDLANVVAPLRLPLEPDEVGGWKRHPLFAGRTPNLRRLSCHASVLLPGHTPHPPHVHRDEEILLLLSGEVTLLLPDLARAGGAPEVRLAAGQLVYYPSQFRHSLRTTGDAPASYLMFRWCNRGRGHRQRTLPHVRFQPFDPSRPVPSESSFQIDRIFQGRTTWLRTLECHASSMKPGGGYAAHVDPYDVAIVVMEGGFETLGRVVEPHDVVFHPAGEPHGLRNPGDVTARYLVFEFHGPRRRRLARGFPLGQARAKS